MTHSIEAQAFGSEAQARRGHGESHRTMRRRVTGTVVSTKMKQTVVVQHETLRRHPRYQKLTRHRTKFYAHDDQSVARLGDTVLLEETRPLSKLKRWRLIEVVKKAESPSALRSDSGQASSGQAEQ